MQHLRARNVAFTFCRCLLPAGEGRAIERAQLVQVLVLAAAATPSLLDANVILPVDVLRPERAPFERLLPSRVSDEGHKRRSVSDSRLHTKHRRIWRLTSLAKSASFSELHSEPSEFQRRIQHQLSSSNPASVSQLYPAQQSGRQRQKQQPTTERQNSQHTFTTTLNSQTTSQLKQGS